MSDTRKIVIELTIVFCLIGLIFCVPGSERYLGLSAYHKLNKIPHKYVEETYIMEYEKYSPDNYVYTVHTFYDKDEKIIDRWGNDDKHGTINPKLWLRSICVYDDYGYAVNSRDFVYGDTTELQENEFSFYWSENRKEMTMLERFRGYKTYITYYDDGSIKSTYHNYKGGEVFEEYEPGEEYDLYNIGTHFNEEAFLL